MRWDESRQRVWSARYIDAPVLRDRDSDGDGVGADGSLGKTGSGLDERLYYLTDANMNVTALIDGTPTSSTLGQVRERYFYDPYGNPTVLHGANGVDPDVNGTTVNEWTPDADKKSDVDNDILFCGYPRPALVNRHATFGEYESGEYRRLRH